MFRDQQIRRLSVVRWVSMAGAEAVFFVGIWGRAAFELQASPGQLAGLMAAMGIAGLLGSALGGVLVDRYGPRTVLVAGESVVVPSSLVLMLPETLGQLMWAVAVANAAAMVAHTAVTSFPVVLTRDPERLARSNAALELASTAAFVVGPAGGAVLATVAGLDALFVANALSSALAAALCAPLPNRLDGSAPGRESRLRWAETVAGARYAYRRPRIRFLLGLGVLTWLSFGAFGALEPLYFRDVLGAAPATLGWVNSVFGIGLAAGAVLLDRAPARFATLPWVAVLTALGGLGAVAYTGTATLAVVLIAAIGWGGVLGLLLPTLRTLVQRETPGELIGRMMGVVQVHERAGDLLPLVVAPGLAAAAGVQAVLVGAGAAVALLAAVLLPLAGRLEAGDAGGAVADAPLRPAVSP